MEPLFRLACGLGVGRVLRWRRRHRLLVLMYHGVVEKALEPFCWHQLPLAVFRRQMDWVRSHYDVLDLERALALRAEGRLPDRACAITFDDGYQNVVTIAGPVLASLSLPATVFLVTDLVGTSAVPWPDRLYLAVVRAGATEVDLSDLGLGVCRIDGPDTQAATIEAALEVLKTKPVREKDVLLEAIVDRLGESAFFDPGPFRMMGWDEVVRQAEGGLLGFAPHSRTHEILSRAEDTEVRRQVEGSQEVLAGRLGRTPRVFAYPNGRAQDFDERSKQAVREAGIPWAVSTVEGLVGANADPLALPRVCVGADLSFARYRLLCAAL